MGYYYYSLGFIGGFIGVGLRDLFEASDKNPNPQEHLS
ncbi:hypothetical protein HPCPY6081_0445 [Helicobacter pylori CPY6081]|nr:hypothetical protein HPCPY6081_0445 [Helicobacter pylori CPY6081]